MDDAARVRRGKTVSNLGRPRNGLIERNRPAEVGSQCRAVQQFGDQVRGPLVSADVEQRQQVRMVQRSCRARFPLEAPEPIRVSGKFSWKNLDRDVTTQARIAGAVRPRPYLQPLGRSRA